LNEPNPLGVPSPLIGLKKVYAERDIVTLAF
jgi:hypothetical protein